MRQALFLILVALIVSCEPAAEVKPLATLNDSVPSVPVPEVGIEFPTVDSTTFDTTGDTPIVLPPTIEFYDVEYYVNYTGQICEFTWKDEHGNYNDEHFGRDYVISGAPATSDSYSRKFIARSKQELRLIAISLGTAGNIKGVIYVDGQAVKSKRYMDVNKKIVLIYKLP